MGQEIELAARAAQELEPAVRDFAGAISRTSAGHELDEWIADWIRGRRFRTQLKILERALDAIERASLNADVVPAKTLVPLLEHGGLEEEDDDMVDRWANLLANAATDPSRSHVAFPAILAQLEPPEARMLDAMHAALAAELAEEGGDHRLDGFAPGFFEARIGLDRWTYALAAANLRRLQLAHPTGRNDPPHVLDEATSAVLSQAIQLTHLGAAFVDALQPPMAERLNVAALRGVGLDS
jgi:hypothetical protein